MRIPRLFLIAFFALGFCIAAKAQDPHVHSRYVKESRTTVIQTDWMYVVNTDQQFLQVGLIARYPSERLQAPLKKVDLLIWSFSRQLPDQSARTTSITIIADGEQSEFASKNYFVFKGETKNGQDIFWAEKKSTLGQPSVLPKEALVRGSEGINGLVMEQIRIELTAERLAKIAHATKLKIQWRTNNVELSTNYLSTIRDFSGRLEPGAQTNTDSVPGAVSTTSKDTAKLPDLGIVNGKALSLPRPAYPALAKSSDASGSVNVLVTIDEEGKVIAATAISGNPLLHAVSIEAARAARFSPTMIKGVAVKVTGIIVYNFVR